MRAKIFAFLTHPITLIATLLIVLGLQGVSGNGAYFFGIFVALTALWASRFAWPVFGLGKVPWGATLSKALLYALLIFFVIDICVQPLVEFAFGEIDLSALGHLRGSLINYVIFLAIMWVFAAFGEEFLYRGYFMKQLASAFGDTDRAWWASGIGISVLFGIAHAYQGPSGMITTGLVGLCFAGIFIKNKTNLMVAILTHGFYDVIGITLIYLGKERLITDWVLQFLR